MMKKIFIGILIMMSVMNLFAQRRGMMSGNMAKSGVLKGSIIDKESRDPIPAVSVYLYSLRDSSLVSGAIADAKGVFEITELMFGKYFAKLSFIGYQDKIIDDIKITPRDMQLDLGQIEINISDINIGEVEVSAERTKVDYRVDKKVISVSNDIISSGGSAVTVLENVPSVEVDVEGNVTLRGSSSFKVFINGKPSVLDASDVLEQIPASTIENIEIITNPSAKYDPEGIGGIINVITKKQKKSGFSGNLELSGSSIGGYKGNALFNYNFNGLTLFTGLNYNENIRKGGGTSIQETFYNDNTSNYLKYLIDHKMEHSGKDIKLGLSYDLTDNSSFSVEGTIGKMSFSGEHESDLYNLMRNDSIQYSVSNSDIFRGNDYYSVYSDFMHKFNNKGHNIIASVFYSNRDGNGDDKQGRTLSDDSYKEMLGLINQTRSIDDEKNEELRMKIDYTNPINDKRKIEAGFQQIFEPKEDEYILEKYDIENDYWLVDDNYSNKNLFDRNISAIYSTYTDEVLGFGYMVGLRGEYTYRNIKLVNSDKNYTIDRFDLFPSLHISKQINEKNQMYVSYSRRLQRPHNRQLDPNPIFRDEYNYMQGNPELEPEYINSYELGYQKYFVKSYISTELYYRNTTNIINRIMEVQDNGIIKHTAANLDEDHSIGMEIMSDVSISPMFTLNMSGNLFYYKLQGNLLSDAVDQETFVYSGRMNAMFRFSRSTSLQANAFYRSKSVTAQGTMSDMWGVNLGARQAFLDNNLVFSLNVRDLFDTFKREFELEQDNFYSFHSMNPISPVVTLSVSYKFNNFKQKSKHDDGEGGDINIEF